MTISSVHNKAVLASLDCAVDELVKALNIADRCGAYDVPAHRRDAEQDEAIIRVQQGREAVEEYGQLFFVDRYGLDTRIEVDVEVP